MSWRHRTAAAAAVVGLAVALFSVSVLGQPRGGATGDPPSAAPVTSGLPDVATLRARLEEVPGDWDAWTALGDAYLRLGTSTADPGRYTQAEEAFARSLELRPEDNDGALAGQAALAAARHDFRGALALAQQALGLNPFNAAALGVRVDALVELGAYPRAQRALRRMLDVAPSTASFARLSYLRELHGDIAGARVAMRRALEFASATTDRLFALQYLGELAFAHGRPETALRRYAAGLELAPGDPALLAARAEARLATGRLDAALADYAMSVARLPDAGHLMEYAAALEEAGRLKSAERQREAAEWALKRWRSEGSADLELAYLLADRGMGDAAVLAAQREYARRVTVHTEDALGYALHVAGRNEEALEHVRAAERLSQRNVTFAYHRGLVEAALGLPTAEETLRRAVELNPYSADGRAAADRLAKLRR